MLSGLVRAAALAAVLASAQTAASDAIVGHARVVDGDTIYIHATRIRLEGIDAPESGQTCRDQVGKDYPCGGVATNALVHRLAKQTVSCVPVGVDRFGRTLGDCSASGESINRWMVREGHALAFRRYSQAYVPDEKIAQAAKKGMWSGTFQAPWEYRRAKAAGELMPPSAIATRASIRCGNSYIAADKKCHK
jgi:endonuclease YncB( thermonuclease family)